MAYSGSGLGTEQSPYEITSWLQLNEVRDYLSSYFILMNDLSSSSTGYDTYASSSANSGAGWEPLINGTTKFTGIFDGQGHTISDVYMNNATSGGLFRWIRNGTVQNLGVINADITTTGYGAGVLADYISGSSGVITNCFTSGSVTGTSEVGGLVGNAYLAAVNNCYSTATVVGTGNIGGLVGYNDTDFLDKCYSTGAVSGGRTNGGLVGYNDNIVANSFWDTQTSGQATSDGGTGKTTAEMKDVDTFTDTATVGLDVAWDLSLRASGNKNDKYVWNMNTTTNDGYPFLTDGEAIHTLSSVSSTFTSLSFSFITSHTVDVVGFNSVSPIMSGLGSSNVLPSVDGINLTSLSTNILGKGLYNAIAQVLRFTNLSVSLAWDYLWVRGGGLEGVGWNSSETSDNDWTKGNEKNTIWEKQ